MLRKCFTVLIIILITAVSGAAFAGSVKNLPVYVPGELFVRFNNDVTQASVDKALSMVNGKIVKRFARIHALHVKVPDGMAKRAVRLLKGLANVKYAERNAFMDLNATTTPNDPLFLNLWGLNNFGGIFVGLFDADIDAPEAWNAFQGTSHMVVADIDTGMDMRHEDLAANLYTNPREIAGNGIDDDGNGYIDDVHGWNFVSNNNDPYDGNAVCNGHGTHTAGTMGAVGNNGIGIAGVNWHIQIMPLKVLGGFYCRASTADVISAVNYAASMGVRVTNNSYGGAPFSQAFKDAIQASRSLFVAAAGNYSQNIDVSPFYPAAYDLPNIISVAATDSYDALASFSNFGMTSVDLSAPGVAIQSTLPFNTYGFLDGTSMASPHVAGAAALLMAKDATLTANEVKLKILGGVDPLGLPVGTGGRLNLNNSLRMPPPLVLIDVAPNGPQTVPLGGSASYSVTITNNGLSNYMVSVSIDAVLPDGSRVPLDTRTFSMQAATLGTAYFTKTIPATLPAGRYDIIGTVEVAGLSYDEDMLAYTVTP